MYDVSNEQLGELLMYAAEGLYFLQEDFPGEESLFPSDNDLSLLDSSVDHCLLVENSVLHLLLCNEFDRAKDFLQLALLHQPFNPVLQLYLALSCYVTEIRPSYFPIAQLIDFYSLTSRKDKNDIINNFLPDDDFHIDFASLIDFNSLSLDDDLSATIRKLCFDIQFYCYVTHYPKAVSCFLQLLPLINETPELLFELAHLLYFTKDYSNVKKLLREVLLSNPQSPKALLLFAETHKRLGEFEQAIGFYWKYLKLEPSELGTYMPLILCYEELNYTQKAVELLENVMDFIPNLENSGWRMIPEFVKLFNIIQRKRFAMFSSYT